MWSFLKKSKGILGMNARNLSFIRPGGSKKAKALVDEKLKTKKFLRKANLPVAKLFFSIQNWQEFNNFDWSRLPDSFALKPNRGFGGEGIMVTFGRKKNGQWVLPLNREATIDDIKIRVGNILDGDYSLASTPDTAFFEERLKIHPEFKLYSYKGIPDVRVIVYNKVPVMAMLRLPTKESSGKANLHQGGIGAGVDILTGLTTRAFQKNKLIEFLPETKIALRGIKIPHWKEILEIAVEAQIVCGLNYVGVDISLDREKGPIILELNARPGLAIQLANLAPLKDRLLRVKGLKIANAEKGIKVAKDLFGGDYEQEIEDAAGRQVVGIIEKVKLIGKNKTEIEVSAKIDTGAGITSIDEDLAIALGYESALNYYKAFNLKEVMTAEEAADLSKKEVWKEIVKHPDIVEVAKTFSSHGASYRMELPLSLTLSGVQFNSNVSVINRKDLKYSMIIGRRDLKRFLVDPNKNLV
jgi:alpha-L-glutamate ligase-like protein